MFPILEREQAEEPGLGGRGTEPVEDAAIVQPLGKVWAGDDVDLAAAAGPGAAQGVQEDQLLKGSS